MTDQLPVKSQTFEERITDRLKDDIGELISKDELRAIVDKTIHKVFFEPTSIPNPQGYGPAITQPPFIEKVVRELLEEHIARYVKEYFAENKEEAKDIVKTVLERELAESIIRGMKYFFSTEMYRMSTEITSNISKL